MVECAKHDREKKQLRTTSNFASILLATDFPLYVLDICFVLFISTDSDDFSKLTDSFLNNISRCCSDYIFTHYFRLGSGNYVSPNDNATGCPVSLTSDLMPSTLFSSFIPLAGNYALPHQPTNHNTVGAPKPTSNRRFVNAPSRDAFGTKTANVKGNRTKSSSSNRQHTSKSSEDKPSRLGTKNGGIMSTTVGLMSSQNGLDNGVSSNNALSRSSYMCRKCRAHGKLLPVKQHKRNCPFRNCTCAVCSLVNYGRTIVAKQIALYRDQRNHSAHGSSVGGRSSDKMRKATAECGVPKTCSVAMATAPHKSSIDDASEDDEGPHCRRCRNHGKSNPWKGHKKICPYRYCICQQCILISLRKSNEKNLSELLFS